MPQKQAPCPNCGQENVYNDPNPIEALAEKMPAALAATVGVKAIGAKSPRLGLIASGLVLAYSVVRYLDGISVTCGRCGRAYKVHHQ
jgi:ribosomal protein S27AE